MINVDNAATIFSSITLPLGKCISRSRIYIVVSTCNRILNFINRMTSVPYSQSLAVLHTLFVLAILVNLVAQIQFKRKNLKSDSRLAQL